MKVICGVLLALGGCALFAQEFEVASIKPSPPPTGNMLRVMMQGGPGTPDPGRLNYVNASLKNVLTAAYKVKGYQISGPGWIDSERFDITAKIPAGTTKEQFQVMLQNLLKERFRLALHKEEKQGQIYALVVAKGGPKLKESEPMPDTPAAAGETPQVKTREGMPGMGPGRMGMMMMFSNGKAKLQANRRTMGDLTDMLGNQLDKPVVDMTELKGTYDFTIEFDPEGMGGPRRMGMPPPGAGGDGGGPGAGHESEAMTSIFTALQEQLGLKLEQRKGSVDMLVIDKLEKVPTDN